MEFHHSERGFTILELLITVGTVTLIAGAIISGIFMVFNISGRSGNHLVVVRQVQNAGYWISLDAQMADNVTTTGLSSPQLLQLGWTDWDGSTYLAKYSLQGGKLSRQYFINQNDSGTLVVAESIDANPSQTSANFTAGKLILTVTARVGLGARQQSETRIYEITSRTLGQ